MEISIIGSGAWGTALSLICARANHNVNLITRNIAIHHEINTNNNHPKFFGITLPKLIKAAIGYKTLAESELVLIALPAQRIREVFNEIRNLKILNHQKIIICSKGIENHSLKLMSEVVADFIEQKHIAILSGPNFSHEIISNLPALTTIASSNLAVTNLIADQLKSENFRLEQSNDPIGIQVYGACKNIIAISIGIARAFNWGENFQSALLAMSIKEINQLNLALGGNLESFFSLAGFGDFNLTCNSTTSRNTSLGVAIASKTIIEKETLTEGFYTANSVFHLSKKLGLDLKIINIMYAILYQNQDPALLKSVIL